VRHQSHASDSTAQPSLSHSPHAAGLGSHVAHLALVKPPSLHRCVHIPLSLTADRCHSACQPQPLILPFVTIGATKLRGPHIELTLYGRILRPVPQFTLTRPYPELESTFCKYSNSVGPCGTVVRTQQIVADKLTQNRHTLLSEPTVHHGIGPTDSTFSSVSQSHCIPHKFLARG